MRQEPNNGIDLLLRQLGRRDESLSPEMDGQHLDADELNSYVANALPAAARARYTSHLADCSSCRKIVAQLSASEVPVAVRQPVGVVAPSGLKSFLASLFSPMVLRYAVPALGLIVVAVVGIVMLRDESRNSSVAQLQDTDQNKAVGENPPAVATPTPVPAAPALILGDTPPNQEESRVAKNAPAKEAQAVAKSAEAPEPKPDSRDYAAQPQEAEKKKETQTSDENASPPRDTRTAEPIKQERKSDSIALAPATIATGSADSSKPAESERAKATAGAGTGAVANFSRDGSRSREEENTRLLAEDARSRREAKRPPKAEVLTDKDSGETQTVNGRNFRKRGDLWIDTAYSYQSTTTVARGSEQYRALVADEPGIHTIAETLKTEFIVVWKGRAYRIR
ncbi:MAG TPA: hypothetical protein VFS77_18160 [Pyrinomonadaceae bacterium]|nr:hypothetical protein [Pyrinomonadaceae bacterium]